MATSALDLTMSREYEEKALEAFANTLPRHDFVPTVGFEMEYSVVNAGSTSLVDEEIRDKIVAESPDLLGQELGAWQLEVKSKPVNLADGGFPELSGQQYESETSAVDAAVKHQAELVRLGSFPLQRADEIRKSRSPRYQSVVNWHDSHHSGIPTSIGASHATRPASAAIVALMNSVQFNVAMQSVDDAINLLNVSLAIVPQIIALSGNSRYLDRLDTRYADTRMLMWERTHDTRTTIERLADEPLRVGLPDRYFQDIRDYVKYVKHFPFLLNKPGAAFAVGTGLNWSDARLKVTDNGVILLEFRPISIQPSVEDDIAICALYLGLLEFHRKRSASLPSLFLIKANRFFAMRDGLNAKFIEIDGNGAKRYMSASRVVAESIEKAKVGLITAGFESGVKSLEILQRRLDAMRVPSDEFASGMQQLQGSGVSFEDALKQMVRGCVLRSGQ